jgi:SWI/SNF-related matrix-associated actin-dependent regulator of chromatin subfamily A member 5
MRLPPRIEAWHLMNKARLYEIAEVEDHEYSMLKPENMPEDERTLTLLSPELQKEKDDLIAGGFRSWTKSDFRSFIQACIAHGRTAFKEIAESMSKSGCSKTAESVQRYARAYWEAPIGEASINPTEWERHVRNVERGDRRREEMKRSQRSTAEFVNRFPNPWEEITFKVANFKASGADAATQDREFDMEEDRFIINCVHLFGSGDWEKIQHAVRVSERFRFDYFLQVRCGLGARVAHFHRGVCRTAPSCPKVVLGGRPREALRHTHQDD